MGESKNRDMESLSDADEQQEESDSIDSKNNTDHEELDHEALELGATVLLALIDGRYFFPIFFSSLTS